jgi:hypothetical protein
MPNSLPDATGYSYDDLAAAKAEFARLVQLAADRHVDVSQCRTMDDLRCAVEKSGPPYTPSFRC